MQKLTLSETSRVIKNLQPQVTHKLIVLRDEDRADHTPRGFRQRRVRRLGAEQPARTRE